MTVASSKRSGQARRDALRGQVMAIIERELRGGATFADLNVAAVAAEAGVSRSTFYAYFVDKANLLRLWYAEFTEVISAAARRWWELDGTATRDDLRAALAGVVEAYRPHPELMAATHEAVGYDHQVREAVEQAMDRYIDGLRAHIEAGQAAGFVDPSLPAAETAYWLQWMSERGLHRMLRTDAGERERLIDAYAGLVWNALYAPVRG